MLAELDTQVGESGRLSILAAFGRAVDPLAGLLTDAQVRTTDPPHSGIAITHLLARSVSDLLAGDTSRDTATSSRRTALSAQSSTHATSSRFSMHRPTRLKLGRRPRRPTSISRLVRCVRSSIVIDSTPSTDSSASPVHIHALLG